MSGLISLNSFRKHLSAWFDGNKRELPWRGEHDAYHILVSEIMLQQTRVAVVKERYGQFLRQFPSISRLARARVESVLAAWSGLGYYRRARALHQAAKHIVKIGAFPRSADELAELPGIGRYTAAAVASIAFAESVAVVDGNVKRVLQRLTGNELSSEGYWQTAQQLLDPRNPGDSNQALMELGATVCVPGQPLCRQCPVGQFCQSGSLARKPVASGARTERRKATLHYQLARKNGTVLLRQRAANISLMPGMWELPQLKIEARGSLGSSSILKLKHSITVTDYTVYVITAGKGKVRSGTWVELENLNFLPLTGLTRKILNKLKILESPWIEKQPPSQPEQK